MSGFDPLNAVDWRDFSLFRPAAGSSTLDFTVAADTALNSAVAWLAPAAGASGTITIQYESSPSTFTTLCTLAVNSLIQWFDFAQVTVLATRKIRINFAGVSGNLDVRQISVGDKLTFPIGQWSDVAPPLLIQGVVIENLISVNGSIIGRNQRRMEKNGKLSLEYLDPAWVRSYWDAFVRSAVFHAFWWRWDPVGHPSEVALTVASTINAPTNMMPPPLMKADMEIAFITP